jgi:hypothetical protein
MKNTLFFLSSFFMIFLIACSGSDTYRGKWKAMDKEGNKFEISFEPKSFTVTDSLGKEAKYDYTQNSVSIKNSAATYGIQLGDGRGYQIHFPNTAYEYQGSLRDENGVTLYTLNRNEYTPYEDIYKLN